MMSSRTEQDREEWLFKLKPHIERVWAQLDILVPGDRAVCGEMDALEGPVLPGIEDPSTGKVGQVYDTSSAIRIANPDSVAISRFDFGWSGHFRLPSTQTRTYSPSPARTRP